MVCASRSFFQIMFFQGGCEFRFGLCAGWLGDTGGQQNNINVKVMDLADLAAKRPALGKIAWKARLTRVVRTKAAKQVLGNTMRNLKAV